MAQEAVTSRTLTGHLAADTREALYLPTLALYLSQFSGQLRTLLLGYNHRSLLAVGGSALVHVVGIGGKLRRQGDFGIGFANDLFG
jgi:hypothetical protein